jgi:hypothetical protein
MPSTWLHNGVKTADFLSEVDIYTAEANVEIYHVRDDVSIEPDRKTIPIKFRIDIEARSWGIKEMSISLVDTLVDVPWHSSYDEPQEMIGKAVVDLTKVKRSVEHGGGMIGISSLDIWLDANNNVDYKRTELNTIGA